MLVKNHDDLDLIGRDLQFMFYCVAGFTTVLVVLVLFCELNHFFIATYSNFLPSSFQTRSTNASERIGGTCGTAKAQSIISLPPLREKSVLQHELLVTASFVRHEW